MKRSSWFSAWAGVSGVAMALWAGLPSPAQACGGTFCDAGPQAMPVDQTGEKILFVMDEGRVEAHIQIQYDPDTDAEKFAWIVPLTVLPEFSVGSDQLFDNLVNSTVPSYGFSTQNETCGTSGAGSSGSGGTDGGGDGDSGTGGGGGTDGDDGPEIVLQETVGAFEVTVLSGGTAEEVISWLDENGYQQDPAAEPILAEYLAENYLFAAFKLNHGEGLDEIHPVVLTFDNEEACIPLRLTRIAASEDMEVRAFFLADQRIVPRNYKHVLVNPLKLDWLNFALNYKEVITLAVDTASAAGKAFVTEYAGPSDVVPRTNLYNLSWDPDALTGAEATTVIDRLENQGIVDCTGAFGPACEYRHPLIQGLLNEYLPVPASLTEFQFYDCLSCYEGLIDQGAWDADAFVAAYRDRIVDPGQHAWEILGAYPYLTRMYTTISPGEMTEDPFFYGNPDLQDVDLRSSFGTRFNTCGGDIVFTLPDGREVFIPGGAGWPEFDDEMPWAEDVEQMLPSGAPESLEDNTVRIDEELAAYNCQFDYPTPEDCEGVGTTGSSTSGPGDDTDGGSGDASTGGSGDTAGSAGTSDSGPGMGTDSDGDTAGATVTGSGCACSADGTTGLAAVAPVSLLLLGLRRRRRR